MTRSELETYRASTPSAHATYVITGETQSSRRGHEMDVDSDEDMDGDEWDDEDDEEEEEPEATIVLVGEAELEGAFVPVIICFMRTALTEGNNRSCEIQVCSCTVRKCLRTVPCTHQSACSPFLPSTFHRPSLNTSMFSGRRFNMHTHVHNSPDRREERPHRKGQREAVGVDEHRWGDHGDARPG